MTRRITWTRDPRAQKPRKTPEVPLNAPLEVYPRVCDGCGEKATLAGGCVDVSMDGEPKRYHDVRCMA